MLATMRRVDIVVPRARAPTAIRTIHRVGVLHPAPSGPPPGAGPAVFGTPPGQRTIRPFEQALERVSKLIALVGSVPAAASDVATLWELPDETLFAKVAGLGSIEHEAARLTAERVRLEGEIARLDNYRQLIAGLARVVGHLPAVRGYSSTGIVVGARYRAVIPLLRDELDSLTGGNFELVAADENGDRISAVLVYPARQTADVIALLGGRDLEEVSLPAELAGIPLDELGPRLESDVDGLRDRLAATDAAVGAIAAARGPLLEALRLVLSDRIEEGRLLDAAARSDHLVVVGGWLPARRVAELRTALEGALGSEVMIVERPVAGPNGGGAPIALENGPLTRFFEPLASFIAVPRYRTLDPTPLLAVTFPAFVGLMVGDAGYGLVALVLLVLARRHWRDQPAMTTIWPVGLVMVIATIAFGILYGEWFGPTGSRLLGIQPIWLDRRESVIPLLILALSIGVAQVGLGLGLGMVTATALHRRRELVSRGALLVTLVAIVVLAATAARLLPDVAGVVAGGALISSLVLLVLTLGIEGPIEALGIVANVLSYARLMAIGLASVMLALVADRLGSLAPNLLAGILIAGLLHALNMSMGFFDASIQGLRLHYVEFFTKFVEPGGTPYVPFASILAGSTVGPFPSSGPSSGGS